MIPSRARMRPAASFDFLRQSQQQVLGGDELVLELLGLLGGLVQNFFERRREIVVRGPADLGQALDGLLRFLGHRSGRHPQPRQKARDNALLLLNQSQQQVHGLQLLVAETAGNVLRPLQGFLGLYRKFVKSCRHVGLSIMEIGNWKLENRNPKVEMENRRATMKAYHH